MLTVTGLVAHLHFNVPPAKLGDSDFNPLSTAGWICTALIALLPVFFFFQKNILIPQITHW
jgi:hypothetical protein